MKMLVEKAPKKIWNTDKLYVFGNKIYRRNLIIFSLQLETTAHRLAFINSAHTLVKGFGFDGIDLAWEFPETKPKKIKSGFGRY